MLKNRSEIVDFLNDEDNWETIPFSEDIRIKKMNLGDKSVRLVELRIYDLWHVSSIQLSYEATETVGSEISTYELVDYIERHKNDQIIKDFEVKGEQ